ncbi:MAG: AAC(3) family N-acetyltransferase [Sedimenticola sp.]|nr:AAC(3) family N-acetyltransferase [Sedimenticola sp.]
MSKSQVIEQLQALGVNKGDTLFVAADLMKVGYFNRSIDQTLKDWVDIFQELLGDTGTIVVPTYSPQFLRFFQKYDFVFTADTASDSGSLAKAYLNFSPGALRGRHPTNSCTSKGFHSEKIAASDGPEFPKYSPYAKVVELGGKNLMLGIVDERNCPFTYHHVQESLGHTKTHPFSRLFETSYLDASGEKKKYIVKEVGGCTGGVHKAWGYHLAKEAVKFGKVGRSLSALVDAKKSAEILYKVMTENPHLIKCDNRSCISCYGRFRYNGAGAIWFYAREFPILLGKVLRRLFK